MRYYSSTSLIPNPLRSLTYKDLFFDAILEPPESDNMLADGDSTEELDGPGYLCTQHTIKDAVVTLSALGLPLEPPGEYISLPRW